MFNGHINLFLALALIAAPCFASVVPAAGAKAPEFTLTAQDGKPVSLKDYRGRKDFCAKEGLNFKLLSDAKAEVSAAYGSLMSDRPLSARNTFLIKPDGTIAVRYLKVDPAGHAEEVLAALAELRRRKAAK